MQMWTKPGNNILSENFIASNDVMQEDLVYETVGPHKILKPREK